MTTELLAPLDLAFWHLESPDHPMHLGALAVFDAAPGAGSAADDEALVELLATRAAAVPRLRMRVRDVLLPVGGAAWSVDKDFDVRSHVRHLELPPGDFAEETARLAGELMERPLERGIPPWEMYVLTGGDGGEGGEGGEGGAQAGRSFAVLVKLHHALADGMRAVAIGAGIFDQIADARAAGTRRARPAPPRSWLPGPWQVADRARDRIGELGRALGIGASVVRASRLDLRATTALVAGSSGTRRLATAVLALEDVRRVRKEHGGTVNDVLLATVAGALRRWMLERGERLPDCDSRTDPRALVPVSGRRPSRARQGAGAGGSSGSGNMFSAYLLGLPVSEPDPLSRLTAVREAMDRNKKDGPSRGPGAVALLAGQLHPLAHRLGAPLAGNAARILFDVLVTSVPLPRATLSFGGCPLREIYPMAPLARGQSLAVGLTTYGGQVHVGLVADGKALPDLDGLAKNMTAELDALLRTTSGEPAPSAGARAEPGLAPGRAVAARAGRPARDSARAATPAAPAEAAPAAEPPVPVQLALIAEPAEPADLAR
ncbi:wax ester/triacylglycerol synthase family O-acyltransferase [Streptomyces niveus]